jgi:hypothetical protein
MLRLTPRFNGASEAVNGYNRFNGFLRAKPLETVFRELQP